MIADPSKLIIHTLGLPAVEAKSIQARDLLGQSTVVFIEHRGERYQLRQTRNGKLILTK